MQGHFPLVSLKVIMSIRRLDTLEIRLLENLNHKALVEELKLKEF